MDSKDKSQTNSHNGTDLVDYVRVIIKRKKLILAIPLMAIIITGAIIVSSPPIYNVTAFLEIGKIGFEEIGKIGFELLERPSQVVEKVESGIYEILARAQLETSETGYLNVKAENPEDTNLIKIEIESSEAQRAENILKEINGLIVRDHQEKIDKRKSEIEENIKETQEELNLLETKKQYSEGIAELQIQLLAFKDQINTLQPTKMLGLSIVQAEPTVTKSVLSITGATVLGIFVGIFLAFLKEWWEKNKVRI